MPSFLLLRGHTLLARHAGSNAELLVSLLKQHSKATPQPALSTASAQSAPSSTAAPVTPTSTAETQEELDKRCKALMNKHKVVLFMKGNPSAPKCGFSRQTVGLLRERGVEFAWFDILSDEGVRSGLKRLNDWPSEWLEGWFPVLISKPGMLIYLSNPLSFPSNHPQWSAYRRSGYFQGVVGERRVG